VYSLSALGSHFQADRVRRADVVANFELGDVEILDASQTAFVCPVTQQEETDVVILVKRPTKGLLADLDGAIANTIITNPLSAIRYPDFCRALADLFDHPVSIRSMREGGYKQSPITGVPIVGGLCLAPAEETCKVTDSVVAQITAEGKRVGHPDCWFLLIWYLLEHDFAPHLRAVLPQVREHLIFRMRRHQLTFTMTNVPYNPITLVPMGVACWATICARAYGVDEASAAQYLKCHIAHLDILIEAVKLIDYPVPDEAMAFVRKFQAFMVAKRLGEAKNFEALKWAIRASHRFVQIDTSKVTNTQFAFVIDSIPIDGPEPDESQVSEALSHLPAEWRNLDARGRRSAAKYLEGFTHGATEFTDFNVEVPLISWGYGMNDFAIPDVSICPATCRPFHIVPAAKTVWYEVSEKVFGSLDDQIRIHKFYIEYVNRFSAYPTREEFLLWVYHNTVPKHHPTLPRLIQEFVECVFRGYENIMATVPIADFLTRNRHSMRIPQKQKMEAEYLASQV
jgi:hypothetical protein